MPGFNRDEIRAIRTFPQLVNYLRDELDWPIEADDFEEITFEYDPEELGIDPKTAAKIQEIKQLRPLVSNQPWGIFFLKFEPKKLPVVVLRRILSKLVIKKQASAKISEQAVWNLHDLLFISNYGEGEQRQITFANFSQDETLADLPTLKVLGWDYEDTELHIDNVHNELKSKLHWPDYDKDVKKWRETWSSAFILRNREVITTSKDLAIRLAALAQRIRYRAKKVLELENANGPMRQLYRAFQETLIHDLKEDDFADMYAQTIAYGLLTARMSRPMGITSSNITDMVPNTNPFLRDILGTFIATGGRQGKIDFDELGIQEIVELLNSPDTHMEAVLRDFGNRTRQEDPVIHFYELFLTEYDKRKKIQRGVFYTPQPVVSYIVRSVHELLQKEFGLPDGLADVTTWGEITKRNKNTKVPEGVSPDEPFVQILDPAVGTATFLVEVINVVYKTMMAKWVKQGHMALGFQEFWNEYVPKHLLPRLYGYELMMAPYAISHMRLGLKLFETGYRFGPDTPRANVYLTNSLEPAGEVGPHRKFEQLAPSLANEAKAVNDVKWNKRFTVVIGNPPYAGISANHGDWITGLVDAYRQVNGVSLEEKKIWVKNDYVKFLRFVQWLVDSTGSGIVGFITDHSYIDSPTFRGMRNSFLQSYDGIFILNLHGNSKRREKAPDGSDDKNVFDIIQGVAISLLIKQMKSVSSVRSCYSELWGTREAKSQTLQSITSYNTSWQSLAPAQPFFEFVPVVADTKNEYELGWRIKDVFIIGSNGVQTSRDSLVTAASKSELTQRFEWIRDLKTKDVEICAKLSIEDRSFWSLSTARAKLARDQNWKSKIKPYLYRPFDSTWIFASSDFVHRLRRDVMTHLERQNLALCVGRAGLVIQSDWDLVYCTDRICDHNLFYRGSSLNLPLYRYANPREQESVGLPIGEEKETNFSQPFLENLAKRLNVRLSDVQPLDNNTVISPEGIFNYIYAIFESPSYRKRYEEFLKIDFPRLPLTSNLELFRALSHLGKELVALHLMESPILNAPSTKWLGSKPSNEVENLTYSDRTVWIDKGQTEGFRGVPENVWNFHIGGYQVCEKWLKDRKGRVLSAEDITHYQKIVVALNETIRIMKEIDDVIDEYGGWPGAFSQGHNIGLESNPNTKEEAQVEIILTKEKETPGTWRFKEDIEDHPMTIYLTKEKVKELGSPESIKVTIEAA